MATVLSTKEGSVMVVVRVRPQTLQEQEAKRPNVVQVVSNCVLVFDPENPSLPGIFGGLQVPEPALKRGKNLTFVFDRVFSENTTQMEVFENTTKGILGGVLNGYNCSVFAYGATGAGKTYTMLGSENEPGIMYFTMVELFRKVEARKEEKYCEILISYQEVYNEQIHDLLEPKGPLIIREDPEKGVVVHGLSYHKPKSAAQLLEMLRRGNLNRTQHPTDTNASSSRSHAIFQIYVKQQDRATGITQDLRMAKMSLIDLAGSERASVANTKGQRLREGANINRSLLALINVINSLADAKNKKSHIPYRDSKLTRLLKDSIGGNCRTIMIAAISPSALSYEDTYNTLKYANRAKEIKVLMKSNVVSVDCPISQYVTVCEQLKAEVANLKERLRMYEENVPEVNLCVAPAFSAPSSLEQDKSPRSKKSCSGCKVLNEDDGTMEILPQPLKSNDGTSFSRGSNRKQESAKNPGPSSAESSNSITPQEKLKTHLQKMDKQQLERVVTTILHVAQRQYALLKGANLLTPDIRAEFGELSRLVSGESDGPPWDSAVEAQARPDGAAASRSLNQDEQQLVENAVLQGYVPTAECVSPTGSPEMPSVSPKIEANLSTVSKTPQLVTKKRKKSTENPLPSERSIPSRENGRGKRRRKACGTPPQLVWDVLPRADFTSTPAPGKTKSPSPSDLQVLQFCPLTVTKSRVPLATSAAQNCSTPASSRGLNTTFDLCENPCPPKLGKGVPECPAWDGVWHLNTHQGELFIPRTSVPVFTMKGSSIPRTSSLASKTSIQKRRRTTKSASQSLGAPRSRIARRPGSSVKSLEATNATGQPSCSLAWKWR